MVNGELSQSKGRKKVPKQLKKADVLGFETGNVNTHWLQPVLRKGAHPAEEDAGAGGSDYGGTHSPSATNQMKVSGMSNYHNPGDSHWAQLSPNYGPGQNTPKELAALRVTKTLQGLGRTAIYSNSPYVESAIAALIPDDFKGNSSGASSYSIPLPAMTRSLHGKLPRRGSKSAALQRAKRLVAQGASFRPEVPFEDAVRVCNMSGDKTAVPALLMAYLFSKPGLAVGKLEHYMGVLAVQPPLVQLQAVALLLQSGYFFSAIKIVYNDLELLRATLEEMRLLLDQGMQEEDLEVAAHSWLWREADRELFLSQFRELQIIAQYQEVRRQLRAMRQQGAVALARVEREMVNKVVCDFVQQLEEDWDQQNEMLKARHDEEMVLATQIAEQQAADAAALAAQQAEAEARALAAAEKRRQDEIDQRQRLETQHRLWAEREAEEASTAAALAELEAAQRSVVATPMAEEAILTQPLEMDPPEEEEEEVEEAEVEEVKPEEAKVEELKRRSRPPSLTASRESSFSGSRRPSLAPLPEGAGSKPGSRVPSRAGSVRLESLGIVHSPAPGGSAPGTPKSLSKPSTPVVLAAAALAVAGPGTPKSLSKPSTPVVLAAAAPGDSAPGTPKSLSKPSTPVVLAAAALEVAGPSSSKTDGSTAPAGSQPGTPKVESKPGTPKIGSDTGTAASATDGEQLPVGSPRVGSKPGTPQGIDALPPGSPRDGSVSGSVPAVPSKHSSRAPSRLQTPSLGSKRESQATGAAPAVGSRPVTAAGSEREGLEQGLAELKMQMSVARKLQEESAEKMKTSGSLSRPATPLMLGTPQRTTPSAENLDDALVAQALAHQELAQAEREQILSAQQELDEEAKEAKAADDRIAAAEAEVEELMHAKEREMSELEEMRAQLDSAQSSRAQTPERSSAQERARVAAEEAEKIRIEEEKARIEAKIAADLAAVEAMKVEKASLERERELERKRFEVRMAEERKALHAQVTKTMKGFQDQLAQSVKMAAMMQAQRIMTGGTEPVQQAQAPQVSLPLEVDDPPTREEILEYAIYLGINVVQDPDLMYIAEWALTAPVPEGWTVHLDTDGHEFFHNNVTAVSCYEHPMDEHYKLHYLKARTQKTRAMATAAGYT